MDTLTGRVIIPGTAEGSILKAEKPISFWGGIDAPTGRIIDTRHDRCGESIAGRIFVFPFEKGSSTASAVLVELVRIGRAPAALITTSLCPVLALGSLIAEELYRRTVPILLVRQEAALQIVEGANALLNADGNLTFSS